MPSFAGIDSSKSPIIIARRVPQHFVAHLLYQKIHMASRLRIFSGARNREITPQRKRILFVSHEATRTGAPRIILNILKHFHNNCDVQCETILHNGGHLASEFSEVSRTTCLNLPRHESDSLHKKVRRFVQNEKGNLPVMAICNSMESRHISCALAQLNIPVISLVHELPSSYKEKDYRPVFDISRKIVFPVKAVRDATDKAFPVPSGKDVVLPQGLLDPDFGSRINRKEAMQQIRKELVLPHDAFIVLGCGTLDLRKGIDHFISIAKQVIAQNKSKTPIHFVWVGDGPRWAHSPFHYLQLDLSRSNVENYVHFIGERENVEPFFVGSDAFLLPSRVDPFPCVIHEAMAAGLPVIAFDESGGAREALADGAGFVVPYGDYDLASNVIRMLVTQPEIALGIRETSLQRVHSKYRFSDYADQLIDMAEALLGTSIRNQQSRKTVPLRIAA